MQGAKLVFTATMPAVCAVASSCIASVLPELKPYQPNHKQNVPNTVNGMLCGVNFSSSTVGSKRPLRGPTTAAPHSAPMPPTMCTMPLPAKSI